MCAAAATVAILKLCCSNEARSVYLYCIYVTAALIYSFSHRELIECVVTVLSPLTVLINLNYVAVFVC